jgi:hypothetical protein
VSNLGDISTLLNPEIVEEIKKGAGLWLCFFHVLDRPGMGQMFIE